ncbi:MAG: diguanylate cyclase [Bacillus subtilis]|nr:diguanylate cyclase [Bacillus subtilis]
MNARIFRQIIMANMVVLAVDFLQVLIDRIDNSFYLIMNIGLTTILYVVGPFLTMLWFRYVDYYIHKDGIRLKKYRLILWTPIALNAIMAILSPIFGWFFVVSPDNVYARGPLFYINVIIIYSYLFVAFGDLLANRNNFRKSSFWPMLLFVIPPAVGGLIQVLFYGLLLVWPMVTISVLMVFVFVQFERANTDYLTGLFNRREYEGYVAGLERRKKKLALLCGLILDLDRFKSINDLFGHDIGDLALKAVADVLRTSFRQNDFLARLGGDEFVALFYVDSEDQIKAIAMRLQAAMDKFNRSRQFEFSLSITIGYDCFRPDHRRIDRRILKTPRRTDVCEQTVCEIKSVLNN